MSNNVFKAIWEDFEANREQPTHMRNPVVMDFKEFEEIVYSDNQTKSLELAESLFAGDAYVLKNAFPVDFLNAVREKTHAWGQASEPHYEPMIDGCKDQHRIIDQDISKKYTYTAVRHSHFFFGWNEDPVGLFEEVNKRWRVFKYLGGFPKNIYESNIPSTGPVDRIQVARYPAGGGGLDAHKDPFKNQKVIIGGMMSKKGVDYETGGIYCYGPNGEHISLEEHIDIGDMMCCYPTVIHGVDAVDNHKKLDWTSQDGRWFLGLYTNDSNYVKDRVSVTRVEEEKSSTAQ